MDDTYKRVLTSWIRLCRLPFLSVGLLPFILGTILAWKQEGAFNIAILLWGMLGIILILLATHHSGEYFDHQEDAISKGLFDNAFAGGSGVFPAALIPRKVALYSANITIALAGGVGLVLQFGMATGKYTLLLGCMGAFCGFFYSTKPIRLVERGIGELVIGFCYGWLPVAAGFYLQAGYIPSFILWLGLAIGFTIFNVIFLNEFPDNIADRAVGKRNLLVRIGKKKGEMLYSACAILAAVMLIASITAGTPAHVIYLYLPVFALSMVIVGMMVKGKHQDNRSMEKMCGLNILVNLGTTLSLIFAHVLW